MALSFVQLCAHGGHWCRPCQRYVEPMQDDHGEPRRCPLCRSVRLRWDPPVPDFHPDETFRTAPENCHV